MKNKDLSEIEVYPILTIPVYKDYIWGGTKIPRVFNRDLPPGRYAESWEVSDRTEGMSVISNGPHKDKTLAELVATMGVNLIGTAANAEIFPLLIKIIDAKQRLSVQVHPNDKQAEKFGGEAKTEMWYVLDAEPGAQVFAGLKKGVNKKTFEEAMKNKTFADVLQSIPAIPGESIFIPGGRIHAIGEGCLLLEVQQNSNTTYRVYDWDRVDANGKPRQLHVDKAMQVINWRDKPAESIKPKQLKTTGGNDWWKIIDCQYFKMLRVDLKEQETILYDNKSFHVIFALNGTMAIEGNGVEVHLNAGMTCLLPAALEKYTIIPLADNTAATQISLV